jgi:exonuclease III
LRQLADASRTADRVAAKDEHGVSRPLGYGSVDALLASLGEDVQVVCLQETKLTGRGDLTPELACPKGWDSAFSVCRDANGKKGKSGYAGVATYFRTRLNVVGAEEGITGVLAEDTSGEGDAFFGDANDDAANAPNAASAVGHRGAMGERFSRSRMRELDAEGRCVLVDFGAFVLFNLYVPAVTSSDEREAEARAEFKRDFLDAAAIRWSALRAAGRNVVLCGDWNVSPAAIDSAHAPSSARRSPAEEAAFVASNPGRLWLARATGNGAAVRAATEAKAPETNERERKTESVGTRGFGGRVPRDVPESDGRVYVLERRRGRATDEPRFEDRLLPGGPGFRASRHEMRHRAVAPGLGPLSRVHHSRRAGGGVTERARRRDPRVGVVAVTVAGEQRRARARGAPGEAHGFLPERRSSSGGGGGVVRRDARPRRR